MKIFCNLSVILSFQKLFSTIGDLNSEVFVKILSILHLIKNQLIKICNDCCINDAKAFMALKNICSPVLQL